MSNRRNSISLGNHIQENFWLYVISLLCVFTGIVIGIYSVKYMASYDRTDLVSYLNNFTQNISQSNFKYSSILVDVIKNNIPLIIAIWFLGLTMIGIPIILLIDVIKGFTVGFTLSFIISDFGTKGLGVAILGVIPQNLIYIPCLIISSVFSMEFSINLLKDKMNKMHNNSIWVKLASYSFFFVAISIIMFIGFALETYLSPSLVKLII
jgi:stage II sporulation protein M